MHSPDVLLSSANGLPLNINRTSSGLPPNSMSAISLFKSLTDISRLLYVTMDHVQIVLQSIVLRQ